MINLLGALLPCVVFGRAPSGRRGIDGVADVRVNLGRFRLLMGGVGISAAWFFVRRRLWHAGSVLLWLGLTCRLCVAAPPVPDWVEHSGRSYRYPDAEYLTGFGVSEESFAAAEEAARSDLARQIEVVIEGEQEFVHQETGSAGLSREEMRFYERSSSRHRVVLQGVHFERYEEKGRYFALAVLERGWAIETYRADLARQLEEIRQSLTRTGAWPDSLRHVIRAATVAGEAWPEARILRSLSRSGEVLDSLYALRSRAVEQFQRLVEEVRLVGRDPAARVAWGEGLAAPLALRLTRGDQILVGVPVEFSFVRGAGELESEQGGAGIRVVALTDAEGQASCRVRRAGSICQDNQVQARLALAQLAALADSAAVALLASRASLPAKVFRFSSQLFVHPPPRLLPVFLNGSAAEQTFADGEKLAVAVRLDGPASLWLLSIDARGRLEMTSHLAVQGEDGGPGWQVRREGEGFVLHFEADTAALQGAGVETLIAVALPPGRVLDFPPGGYQQGEALWKAIAQQAGTDSWSAGWASYELKAKR